MKKDLARVFFIIYRDYFSERVKIVATVWRKLRLIVFAMKFPTELFSITRDSLHIVAAILELQTELSLSRLEPDIRGIERTNETLPKDRGNGKRTNKLTIEERDDVKEKKLIHPRNERTRN